MNPTNGEKGRDYVERPISEASQISRVDTFFFFRDGCAGAGQVHKKLYRRGLERSCGRLKGVPWDPSLMLPS